MIHGPRAGEPGPLRGPHLVLADARRHQEVALGQLRELVDDVLRHDRVVALVVGHRVGRAPGVDLLRATRASRRGSTRGLIACRNDLTSVLIADVRGLVLVDLGGVDVDVDDLAVLGELAELAGHAVVEPDAEGEQQVGVVDRVVGVDRAVHPEHIERQVMVAREATRALAGSWRRGCPSC